MNSKLLQGIVPGLHGMAFTPAHAAGLTPRGLALFRPVLAVIAG